MAMFLFSPREVMVIVLVAALVFYVWGRKHKKK